MSAYNKAFNARPTSWPGQSLLRPFWCMSLRANLHQKHLRSACPLTRRFITWRRPSIKTCPYCTERLPFFNLIKQRLTFSEKKAIECPNCKSTISSQGGASIWWSFGFGSTSGYLFGKLLSSTSISFTIIVASIFIGLFIFILSAYFTAPIRTS